MTTTTSRTPAAEPDAADPTRTAVAPIPLTRIVGVELRKMVDTRAGSWLVASVAIVSVLATAAMVIFAGGHQLAFDSFLSVLAAPMTVILPMIGILAVTSEWSQRTGLSTFSLVPNRDRVLGAKFLAVAGVGVVSMLVAVVFGALGTLVSSAVAGVALDWNVSLAHIVLIVLGSVLGMLFGFMLGLVIRSSVGAVVTYFIATFVLPSVLGLLAAKQAWFADLQPWVDFADAQRPLFLGALSSQQWQHLATAGALWLVLPMAIGRQVIRRVEIT